MTRHHVLVVANAPVPAQAVVELAGLAAGAEVLVVAPALNTRLRHWLSDSDGARLTAEQRLRDCLDRLGGAGVRAVGMVGDADPLQATDDALHVFAADRIVIAAEPAGRTNWLARDLVERVGARFAAPVVAVAPP